MKFIGKLCRRIIKLVRNNIIYSYYRKKLKNRDFTLIANSCNGTFILYDLRLKYNTPTINLLIEPNDFIKFCAELDFYLSLNITFIKIEGIHYPVGLLGDVKVFFVHYKNEDEAKFKWEERRLRVNYNDIFILMTEKDDCSVQILKEFDNLPYDNKVVLTHKDYPQFKSAYKINGFEDKGECGFLYEYRNVYSLRRYLYDFNFIRWFNK